MGQWGSTPGLCDYWRAWRLLLTPALSPLGSTPHGTPRPSMATPQWPRHPRRAAGRGGGGQGGRAGAGAGAAGGVHQRGAAGKQPVLRALRVQRVGAKGGSRRSPCWRCCKAIHGRPPGCSGCCTWRCVAGLPGLPAHAATPPPAYPASCDIPLASAAVQSEASQHRHLTTAAACARAKASCSPSCAKVRMLDPRQAGGAAVPAAAACRRRRQLRLQPARCRSTGAGPGRLPAWVCRLRLGVGAAVDGW